MEYPGIKLNEYLSQREEGSNEGKEGVKNIITAHNVLHIGKCNVQNNFSFFKNYR